MRRAEPSRRANSFAILFLPYYDFRLWCRHQFLLITPAQSSNAMPIITITIFISAYIAKAPKLPIIIRYLYAAIWSLYCHFILGQFVEANTTCLLRPLRCASITLLLNATPLYFAAMRVFTHQDARRCFASAAYNGAPIKHAAISCLTSAGDFAYLIVAWRRHDK